MNAVVLGLVLTAVSGSAGAAGAAKAAKAAKSELVFVGTVRTIKTIDAPDQVNNFVVTMSVDEVQFGELPASTFSFAIHSPGRADLEVGGVYTIEARWNGDGYVVDELRIRRRPKRK